MSDQPEDSASEPNLDLDDLFDSLPPEEQAFWDDLKAGYTNPEIYDDSTQPQIFVLPIRSLFFADKPMLIYSEINGDVFPAHFIELLKHLMTQNPNLDKVLTEYGETLDEHIAGFMDDPNRPEFQSETWKFFLRHFPKFLISAFNIAVISAVMRATLVMWRREPDSQLNEMEKLAKDSLEVQMVALEKMVKQLVGTRSTTGRPKTIYGEGELPEIVRSVARTAYDLMGAARGKDAAPGLKAVALKLRTNEGALSRRLRLAGHPWTGIKKWLENISPDST